MLLESPEAAGINLMSFLCCNYWMVKTLAEPFLNTSHTIQTLIYLLADGFNTIKSKIHCCCCEVVVKIEDDLDYMESNSKQEDERKNRNLSFTSTSVSSIIAKFGYYATILMAYAIILLFIYASFTI